MFTNYTSCIYSFSPCLASRLLYMVCRLNHMHRFYMSSFLTCRFNQFNLAIILLIHCFYYIFYKITYFCLHLGFVTYFSKSPFFDARLKIINRMTCLHTIQTTAFPAFLGHPSASGCPVWGICRHYSPFDPS
jgi:hypothetical protein